MYSLGSTLDRFFFLDIFIYSLLLTDTKNLSSWVYPEPRTPNPPIPRSCFDFVSPLFWDTALMLQNTLGNLTRYSRILKI